MARHDTPCKNLQSLIFLAEANAFQKHISVFISNENINPIYYSECYKIQFLLVFDFVLSTHNGLVF